MMWSPVLQTMRAVEHVSQMIIKKNTKKVRESIIYVTQKWKFLSNEDWNMKKKISNSMTTMSEGKIDVNNSTIEIKGEKF